MDANCRSILFVTFFPLLFQIVVNVKKKSLKKTFHVHFACILLCFIYQLICHTLFNIFWGVKRTRGRLVTTEIGSNMREELSRVDGWKAGDLSADVRLRPLTEKDALMVNMCLLCHEKMLS